MSAPPSDSDRAMIERIAAPLDKPWWEPPPDSVRFHFVTGRLMERAGIPQDSPEADDRYLKLMEPLAADIWDVASIRATGYRSGPGDGGGDVAFIDLVIRGSELPNAAGAILKAATWLRKSLALDLRISERGIETLARWELERTGLDGKSELVSLSLMPGEPHRGYVLLFRLRDGRQASMTFSLDGVLQVLSIEPAGSPDAA
jgi:hypothetical protein